jgi:hypothetical protein
MLKIENSFRIDKFPNENEDIANSVKSGNDHIWIEISSCFHLVHATSGPLAG